MHPLSPGGGFADSSKVSAGVGGWGGGGHRGSDPCIQAGRKI